MAGNDPVDNEIIECLMRAEQLIKEVHRRRCIASYDAVDLIDTLYRLIAKERHIIYKKPPQQ